MGNVGSIYREVGFFFIVFFFEFRVWRYTFIGILLERGVKNEFKVFGLRNGKNEVFIY